ncbi:hypothetical protein D3C83_21580 [compost metagenome]
MQHGDAILLHFILRQVNAAHPEIEFDILPEVDELQRRADRVGVLEISGRGAVEEMQEQTADRVGGAPAVVEHFGKVRVALADDILGKCGEQVVESAEREPVIADHAGEIGEPAGIGRLPALDFAQLPAKTLKLLQPDVVGGISLVGEIVRIPGKTVDQCYRIAKLGGEE